MAQARRKSSQKKRKSNNNSRSKSSRSSVREALAFVDDESTRSILREGLAVFYLLVAVFILTSILSHQWWLTFNPTQHLMSDQVVAVNLMGPFGHVLATLMTGVLGLSSLLLPFWLGVMAYDTWFPEDREEQVPYGVFLRVLGVFGSFIVAAGFVALVFGSHYGGSIGSSVSQPLVSLFGFLGGSLVFGSLFVLLLALATGSSVLHILSAALDRSLTFFGFSLKVIGFMIGAAFAGVKRSCSFIVDKIRYRGALEEDDWEEEAPLPKPRRRKSRVELREIEAEPEEFEDQEEPDIVRRVMAQSRSGKASRKELTKARRRIIDHARQSDSEFYASYEPPALEHLRSGVDVEAQEDDSELRDKSRQIEQKLSDFQIKGRVTHVHPGPVITLYEFEPAAGVKVGRIAALQDDLAMSLRASSIRIIAPIPRRGTVGIEVPNRNYELVRLRDLLESEAFINDDSLLTIPLGKDTYGNPVVEDVAKMPHLLMAGATGTGKSVCINAFLVSLLYRATPAELGLILIDPKILELSIYDGIPHLRVPVVTDPKKARAVLFWAVNEMERRYQMMQKYGVRSIDGYNRMVKGEGALQPEDEEDQVEEFEEDEAPSRSEDQADLIADEDLVVAAETLEPLPKLVIVIDELADLMLSSGREIEELITRLAQKARASGIHLILATQRPSVDVITGLIKANFPARLSFRVSSRIDSRTILDSMGSEKLLGRGDMLYMRPGGMHLQRVHGAFVSDAEVKRVVEAIKESCPPRYDDKIIEMCEKALEDEGSSFSGDGVEDEEYDSFYDKAVELVVDKGSASTSMIQRAFRIGYNRAARIIDTMEREGIVGPMDGAKAREVLLRSDEVENG